jgi:hypothetical protein
MAQEQSKRFGLPSGAALVVTVAPFRDAWALTKAALRSLKGGSPIASEALSKDFKSMGAAAAAVPGVLDRLISLATSEEVEALAFECAKSVLYIPPGSVPSFPGIRVDRDLFDDPVHGEAARGDLAMILMRIMEVNCKPFLARALSALSALKGGGKSDDPGLKTS